jgi:anti-sigma B factor antagonist
MIIHQLRRAGERAATRNRAVMHNGAVVKHGDKQSAERGRATLSERERGYSANSAPMGSVISLYPPTAGDRHSRTSDRFQAIADPEQLRLSQGTDVDGRRVVSMSGELDIATAQEAYTYISDVIDQGQAPVSVDLGGITFCDASGLGALARVAKHARQTGRQLKLTSARPPLLKIMRITGLDSAFPELTTPALAHR